MLELAQTLGTSQSLKLTRKSWSLLEKSMKAVGGIDRLTQIYVYALYPCYQR